MKVSEVLETAVTEVTADAREVGGLYERRVFAESPHELHVTLAKPSGFHGICLGVHHSAISGRCDVDTRAFRVWIEPTGAQARVRVRLEETHGGFGDLFRQLRDDVVRAILQCSSEEGAVVALRSRVSHWERFMERAADGLSDTDQIGLYGELRMISRLLECGASPSQVLSSWKGPLAGNHDFEIEGRALEVKSTVANADTKVVISNERQLDSFGLSVLFLAVVSLDRRQGAGQTLPELIDDLRNRLDGANSITFEDRLLAAGFHHSKVAMYSAFGYQVRRSRFFMVGEGFPRIIPADLKPAVHDVSYCVETSGAATYLVPERVALGALAGVP